MNRSVSLALGAFLVFSALPAIAQQQAGVVPRTPAVPGRMAARSPRPGTGATIQGNAMRSSGGLPNSTVRLRDARFGRVVDTQVTDKAGVFAFRGVDPGNYIVEIVSQNQTTIAATQMLTANAGETVTAVVRLPIQPSMFAGILGQQSASAGAGAPAGVTEIIPQIVEQLPQAAVQGIPAVVAAAPPASEQR